MKLIRYFSTVLAILCVVLSSCSSVTTTEAPCVPLSRFYDPTRDLMEGDTNCYEPQLVLGYPKDELFLNFFQLQQALVELSDEEFFEFSIENDFGKSVLMSKEEVALWISTLEQRGFFVLFEGDSYYVECDPYTYQLETNGYEMAFTHMYTSFSKDDVTYRFRYNWLSKVKPTPEIPEHWRFEKKERSCDLEFDLYVDMKNGNREAYIPLEDGYVWLEITSDEYDLTQFQWSNSIDSFISIERLH